MMRLLDLFCGAGGASAGYWRAGFDVVGVDVVDQPSYPFEFVRADALSMDYEFLLSFDVIHASPPCQQYSCASAVARSRGAVYPDLVHPVRAMLKASGLPYIIENVPGAPVRGVGLCGCMFGLDVRRRRIFESNVKLFYPAPCSCSERRSPIVTVAGAMFDKASGAAAMGIDWPIDKYQLKEAIPPAYTQWLGMFLWLKPEPLRNSVSEVSALSVHERQDRNVTNLALSNGNEQLLTSVTDHRGATVTESPVLTVSERRSIPVARRCGSCGAALPSSGTARQKFCNGTCRLRAFRTNQTEVKS
jgi:DNA (cytosine-5)-methyltransferase 1